MLRLVTTTVTAPLDMIKTNMYAAGDLGALELTSRIVHTEGLQGLLRGWSAAYVRLGKCIVFESRCLRRALFESAIASKS